MTSKSSHEENAWSSKEWREQEKRHVTILGIWLAACGAVGYFIDLRIGMSAAPPGLIFSLVLSWIVRDWRSGLGWWHIITTLIAFATTAPWVAMYFGVIG